MKKKVLSILVCGVLLCGITGCGDQKGKTESLDTQQTDNNNQKENNNIEKVKLGKTISLDFVEVTLDSLEVKDKYKFKYTKGTSSRTVSLEPRTSDFKLISLRGNFINKSSKEIYPTNNPMYGTIKINGNEYKGEFATFNTKEAEKFYTIVSQQKVEYFFYAEIPETIADEIKDCEITFGFKKDFEGYTLDISDLDYIYTLNALPENK